MSDLYGTFASGDLIFGSRASGLHAPVDPRKRCSMTVDHALNRIHGGG